MIEKRLMGKIFVGLCNYWLSAPDFDSTSNLVISRVIPVFLETCSIIYSQMESPAYNLCPICDSDRLAFRQLNERNLQGVPLERSFRNVALS